MRDIPVLPGDTESPFLKMSDCNRITAEPIIFFIIFDGLSCFYCM
jgi:hypothetical protein